MLIAFVVILWQQISELYERHSHVLQGFFQTDVELQNDPLTNEAEEAENFIEMASGNIYKTFQNVVDSLKTAKYFLTAEPKDAPVEFNQLTPKRNPQFASTNSLPIKHRNNTERSAFPESEFSTCKRMKTDSQLQLIRQITDELDRSIHKINPVKEVLSEEDEYNLERMIKTGFEEKRKKQIEKFLNNKGIRSFDDSDNRFIQSRIEQNNQTMLQVALKNHKLNLEIFKD